MSSGVSQFTVNVASERRRGLQLRGDILIKCYHRGDVGRETIFSCQFHTCAVADYTLSFTKQELDYACNGKEKWRTEPKKKETTMIAKNEKGLLLHLISIS